jgi:hypothetical protein
VYSFTSGSNTILSGYHAAHTTTSTDSEYWTDINSMTADEAAGDGAIYYCVSTDDRTTWKVAKGTDGERSIVRNNSGTWQYNSNATYGSTTWANATTNAELAAIQEAMTGASGSFSLAGASYNSKSFSVNAQDTSPRGMYMKPDGTALFVVGGTGKDIITYTLSTANDITTASFTRGVAVDGYETAPRGVEFKTDGTKMFVTGYTNDNVLEYGLSTAWNTSTSTYTTAFSVSSQDGAPVGIRFKSDGTKMYMLGQITDTVYQYSLSTAWDVSSASYDSVSFSVNSQESAPADIYFSSDGTKMFAIGESSNTVFQYTLSTAWDLSSASYSSNSFSVASQETVSQGLVFSNSGNEMFVVGENTDTVYQYSTLAYPNQMNKTQLDAIPDANHFTLANDLDLAIIFNLSSGSTIPSSDGVAINYDANVLNQGAILGTDYTYDAPAQNKVRITSTNAANLKVRIV